MNIDLQNVGLNSKESDVYTVLLESGESTVANIAKKTGINRSLCYFILADLEKKGFAGYMIKNNVRYYKPIEPQKILNIINEKKQSFENLLPKLVAIYNSDSQKPRIEILEGKEGIKTILNEILRLKKDWYAFNIPGKGHEILGPMVDAFEKERQKLKIRLFVLCTNTPEGRKRGKEFAAMKFTQVRYMKEKYESPASNYIYGDRLAIIFWYKQFPFAIRIIDKSLATSYENYFKSIWKNSKK